MVPTEDTMDPRRRFGRRSARATSGETPNWPAAAGSPGPGRLLTVEDRRRPGAGSPVPARLLPVEARCWQCRSKVREIVGVLVDPALTSDKNGFLPFDAIGPQLAAALDPRTLSARRIGRLKHRESPGVPGGYLSNGCIECDE